MGFNMTITLSHMGDDNISVWENWGVRGNQGEGKANRRGSRGEYINGP